MCLKIRSTEPELMDLGPLHYTRDEYHDCLNKLGIIGNLLGGNRATFKALKAFSPLPISFVDIGCGNGALVLWLAQRFPKIAFVGMDIDPEAIIAANKLEKISNVSFQHQKEKSLKNLDQTFDIVHACLVCHHMSDTELVQFLSDCRLVARRAIVINDLQRSWLAYALFWVISPFFRNRMIRTDGLISIKRGFTKAELKNYLKQAGYAVHQYTITWRWAFRWVVVVKL